MSSAAASPVAATAPTRVPWAELLESSSTLPCPGRRSDNPRFCRLVPASLVRRQRSRAPRGCATHQPRRKQRTWNELERLRLPELARFREVTDETSGSPNRKFLIRRIRGSARDQPARS